MGVVGRHWIVVIITKMTNLIAPIQVLAICLRSTVLACLYQIHV